MKQHISTLGLALLTLCFVACSHSRETSAVGQSLGGKSGYLVTGHFQPNGNFIPTQMKATNRYNFMVTQVNGETLDNGIKRAQLSLQNRKDKAIVLEYRFFWYDENDMEIISGADSWQPIELAGKVSRTVQSVAWRQNATRFEVYIRELPKKPY